MTARRRENAAAWVAALLVVAAFVLLAAFMREHPTGIGPGSPEDALRAWFRSLRFDRVALLPLPIIALPIALAALWRRLATDGEVRADIRLALSVPGRLLRRGQTDGEVRADIRLALIATGRLLRRPVLLAGAFATLGSLAILAFAITGR